MLSIKRMAMAILVLSCRVVIAGTVGPACMTTDSVTIPCETSAWDFTAQALLLKTSDTGIGNFGSTFVPGRQFINKLNNKWGWGFKLAASYRFSTGNDLDLNWYHDLRAGIVNVNNNTDELGNQTIGIITAGIEPRWDAVNLEFGQRVDFAGHETFRFHGGFQYGRVQTTFNLNSSGTITNIDGVPISGGNVVIYRIMQFSGFGPRVGTDLSYRWGMLGVYANGAMAILVGNNSFYRAYSPTGITTANVFTGSHATIIPEVEAKFGATYTYAMAQGDAILDLGWMWVNYFNVQHEGYTTAPPRIHDFGMQGPYIGMKWVGNVA